MSDNPRKQYPMFYGLLAYFPDALNEVSHVSWKGNEQHNPGEPLHWAREKSADDLDAAMRHLKDRASGKKVDDDGLTHLAKAAWRILAALQKESEEDTNWRPSRWPNRNEFTIKPAADELTLGADGQLYNRQGDIY